MTSPPTAAPLPAGRWPATARDPRECGHACVREGRLRDARAPGAGRRATRTNPARLVKGEAIAKAQDIPLKFLEGILRQLRQSGIVASQRGADGGYRLDRDPKDVSIADVVRALDGPLAAIRGQRPEDLDYTGASEHLREVWIAVRASMRHVLEHISLADVASGDLPAPVTDLLAEPGAWQRR